MSRQTAIDEKLIQMHSSAMKAYLETLVLKNYSVNTVKNYRNHFQAFLAEHKYCRPSEITKKQVLKYLYNSAGKKSGASEMNQKVNAIKFFYEKVLKRPRQVYDLPRAKKPFQLPGVFSGAEVKAILDAAENLKHKCILCIAYAGGLRVSEIVSLKLKDIDSERMVINIRQGKGRKDRIVMLSEKLLSIMRVLQSLQAKGIPFRGSAGRKIQHEKHSGTNEEHQTKSRSNEERKHSCSSSFVCNAFA